jgi:hypothetical protein
LRNEDHRPSGTKFNRRPAAHLGVPVRLTEIDWMLAVQMHVLIFETI